MRYTVLLQQEPDKGYIVSIPALPGCISQGNTRMEAMDNIREASGYISMIAEKRGTQFPQRTAKSS